MNCNLISYDFLRFFWLKMSLKRAPISSKSSPNFKIELRTSRTLFPSPEVELNELEHLKSRTFRTRTQVRSITTPKCAKAAGVTFVKPDSVPPAQLPKHLRYTPFKCFEMCFPNTRMAFLVFQSSIKAIYLIVDCIYLGNI